MNFQERKFLSSVSYDTISVKSVNPQFKGEETGRYSLFRGICNVEQLEEAKIELTQEIPGKRSDIHVMDVYEVKGRSDKRIIEIRVFKGAVTAELFMLRNYSKVKQYRNVLLAMAN